MSLLDQWVPILEIPEGDRVVGWSWLIVSIGSDSLEGCFPSDLLVLVIPCLNNRFSSTPCIFRCIGLEKFREVIQLLRVLRCT